MRRMDRYKEEETNSPSRLDKNQELYRDISSNTVYTNITDVRDTNAYVLDNHYDESTTHTTREAYQQMQKYQNMEPVSKPKKDLEDFNYLYQTKEKKVYDINSFLEEARKNRPEKDEMDEKRKLKNNAYNILSGINRKELEKYREEKKKRLATPEEEEIREFIDTIASKTLAGEIDKDTTVDLLSDLMATNMLEKVGRTQEIEEEKKEEPQEEPKEEEPAENTQEIEENNEEPQEEKKEEDEEPSQNQALDFYTRSMDLSDKDFDLSDEFKEKQLTLPVKILLFLIIIALVLVASYFIYQRII